jgi:hypothetical protein
MRHDDVLIWKVETCRRAAGEIALTVVGCQYTAVVYQTTGCHVRTSGPGTSVQSELTKVAFRQPQVPIFRQNHAIQQCRLVPLPEYNGHHYQSVGPGGNSYELHSEGVRLVSGARRRPSSRYSASSSSFPPCKVCNGEIWSCRGSDGVKIGRYVPTFWRNLQPPSSGHVQAPLKGQYVATRLHDVTCRNTVMYLHIGNQASSATFQILSHSRFVTYPTIHRCTVLRYWQRHWNK